MSDKIKESLSVFFKHIYHILQHPERIIISTFGVYAMGCFLLMLSSGIIDLPDWGETSKIIASYGALILVFIWMLVLFGFVLTPPELDTSSIKNESWIYDSSANKLMLWEIREHCKRSCTAEHCNNCALRKYTEEK